MSKFYATSVVYKLDLSCPPTRSDVPPGKNNSKKSTSRPVVDKGKKASRRSTQEKTPSQCVLNAPLSL